MTKTAASFWAINSKDYDTYMVSQTDRISFKCEDLYKFVEAYAKQQVESMFTEEQVREALQNGGLSIDEDNGECRVYRPLNKEDVDYILSEMKYDKNNSSNLL